MISEIFTHRSIRRYKSDPIPEDVLQRILEAGVRASNTGNMQVYSIIVTKDAALRDELAPCHFNQGMVRQAPVLLTFCADVWRFSLWCKQRGTEPEYDNFLWYINGTIDASLASQNIALAAEAEGLGICYLGTAVYNAAKIIEILRMPKGVIPIVAMSVGYPDEQPTLTDRLPLEAVIHNEYYNDYTPESIDAIWKERESSSFTQELIRTNELPNLARIFTDRRYSGKDNLAFSRSYFETLKAQGFFEQ